jgi:hypothetical protein
MLEIVHFDSERYQSANPTDLEDRGADYQRLVVER